MCLLTLMATFYEVSIHLPSSEWFLHGQFFFRKIMGGGLCSRGYTWRFMRFSNTNSCSFIQIMFKVSPGVLFSAEKCRFQGVDFFHLHFLHVPLRKYWRYAYHDEVLLRSFHLPKKVEKSAEELSSYEEIWKYCQDFWNVL